MIHFSLSQYQKRSNLLQRDIPQLFGGQYKKSFMFAFPAKPQASNLSNFSATISPSSSLLVFFVVMGWVVIFRVSASLNFLVSSRVVIFCSLSWWKQVSYPNLWIFDTSLAFFQNSFFRVMNCEWWWCIKHFRWFN